MSRSAARTGGRRTMEILARARPASLDRGAAASAANPTAIVAAARAGEEPPLLAPSRRGRRAGLPVRVTGTPARRALFAGAGLTVTAGAAAAAAVVAAVGGGAAAGGDRGQATVLTAAMVQQVASASRAAMARSGRVVIAYSQRGPDGVRQVTGVNDITFSGRNWNDAMSMSYPAAGSQPPSRQFSINRMVGGRFYLYAKRRSLRPSGQGNRMEWVRDTNPSGHPSIRIPDPRDLLRMLEPAVRFRFAGYQVIGGMRLEKLRAEDPGRAPEVAMLSTFAPGGRLTQLTVWADRHKVVRRISLIARQVRSSVNIRLGHPRPDLYIFLVPNRAALAGIRASIRKLRQQTHARVVIRITGQPTVRTRSVAFTSMLVTFSSIGNRQVITAPRHAVPVRLQG